MWSHPKCHENDAHFSEIHHGSMVAAAQSGTLSFVGALTLRVVWLTAKTSDLKIVASIKLFPKLTLGQRPNLKWLRKNGSGGLRAPKTQEWKMREWKIGTKQEENAGAGKFPLPYFHLSITVSIFPLPLFRPLHDDANVSSPFSVAPGRVKRKPSK